MCIARQISSTPSLSFGLYQHEALFVNVPLNNMPISNVACLKMQAISSFFILISRQKFYSAWSTSFIGKCSKFVFLNIFFYLSYSLNTATAVIVIVVLLVFSYSTLSRICPFLLTAQRFFVFLKRLLLIYATPSTVYMQKGPSRLKSFFSREHRSQPLFYDPT